MNLWKPLLSSPVGATSMSWINPLRAAFRFSTLKKDPMAGPRPGMQVTSQVRLTELLKRGGMGSVWLAEHEGLQTKVVVKFMDAASEAHPDARMRFSREAAAASRVKSPHVVQVFDHGVSDDGTPYIVMEHLEGHDLETHIQQNGALPAREVVEIFTQLSRALEKTHAAAIVHRDLKPGNIFLCDAGDGALFVKLLDFGIAKGAIHKKLDAATQTGSMLGSPFYMSPEQIVGSKDVDARTDLWALGVIGFETLTGHRPFEAETIGALALLLHNGKMPIPSEKSPAMPPAIDTWFARACAREASERFSSARELTDALASALGASRDHVRRPLGSPAGASLTGTASTVRATSEPAAAITSPEDSALTPGKLAGGSTQLGMATRGALPMNRSPWAPLFGGAAVLALAAFGALALMQKSPAGAITGEALSSSTIDLRPPKPSAEPVIAPVPTQSAAPSVATTGTVSPSASVRLPVVKSTTGVGLSHPSSSSTAARQDDIF